jgi:hypothetical protein
VVRVTIADLASGTTVNHYAIHRSCTSRSAS